MMMKPAQSESRLACSRESLDPKITCGDGSQAQPEESVISIRLSNRKTNFDIILFDNDIHVSTSTTSKTLPSHHIYHFHFSFSKE